MVVIALAERRLVPEPIIRAGIRLFLRDRLAREARRFADRETALRRFVEQMGAEELAPSPGVANRQHYEVPTEFFQLVLGRHLKYSAGLWEPGTETLDEAEAAMLALTCARADLRDGQTVLELGCGWGSLSLWMAVRYPRSRFLVVSNSRTQGAFIRARAAEQRLVNLEVRTADMNGFTIGDGALFDRIVSVEMFEHMRNWPELYRRVAGWLAPGGRVFVHVFAHRRFAYPFEVDGDRDWMAKHFFTGGIMPAHDLAGRIPGPLEVEENWLVPGTHYARTAEAWVARLAERRAQVLAVLRRDLPAREARLQLERWRLFFLACAELFGFRGGTEWVVSHHRLRARQEEGRP
ncbi:MAG TPA: cyclopropane-fatty-acyl-phospholipid synthase family protein [Anaeromyxobacter sp.]|nr:cyclopropane-fatty-acyl-phospholipid synthase family protein [Anaeromyxobacter sp.]